MRLEYQKKKTDTRYLIQMRLDRKEHNLKGQLGYWRRGQIQKNGEQKFYTGLTFKNGCQVDRNEGNQIIPIKD